MYIGNIYILVMGISSRKIQYEYLLELFNSNCSSPGKKNRWVLRAHPRVAGECWSQRRGLPWDHCLRRCHIVLSSPPCVHMYISIYIYVHVYKNIYYILYTCIKWVDDSWTSTIFMAKTKTNWLYSGISFNSG